MVSTINQVVCYGMQIEIISLYGIRVMPEVTSMDAMGSL